MTRKLLSAILCLVFSLTFCVWAVFAWFAANNAVDANGIQTSVSGSNLSLVVNVYQLKYDSTTDSYSIDTAAGTAGLIGSSESGTYDGMATYTGLSTDCTAVLVEVIATNNSATKSYVGENALPLKVEGNPFAEPELDSSETTSSYNCDISNAVAIYEATTTDNTTFTKGTPGTRFIKIDSADSSNNDKYSIDLGTVELHPQGSSNSSNTATVYCIMDYDGQLIDYLRGLLGTEGGASTNLNFTQDLSFSLGLGAGSSGGGTTGGDSGSGDTHTHSYSYTSNGNGTHTITCNSCDYSATENCDTNGQNGACSKCGYTAIYAGIGFDGMNVGAYQGAYNSTDHGTLSVTNSNGIITGETVIYGAGTNENWNINALTNSSTISTSTGQVTISKYLCTRGGSRTNRRAIQFTLQSGYTYTIKVWAAVALSGNTGRFVCAYNGEITGNYYDFSSGNAHTNLSSSELTTTMTCYEMKNASAGTWYIGGTAAINIYYIEIIQESSV